MANLSPYNTDKIAFILLTLLTAFPPVWGMHNLLPSSVICFSFCFGCIDCSLYTKNLFDWEFIYFSLWSNYYFVIESSMYFILLTMVCRCVGGEGEEGNKDQMWDGSKEWGRHENNLLLNLSFYKICELTYGIE